MLPKVLAFKSISGWKPKFQLELCKPPSTLCNEGLSSSGNEQMFIKGSGLGCSTIHKWHDPCFPRVHSELRKLEYSTRDCKDETDDLGFGLLIHQVARTVHSSPPQGFLGCMRVLWDLSQGCYTLKKNRLTETKHEVGRDHNYWTLQAQRKSQACSPHEANEAKLRSVPDPWCLGCD